MKLLVAKGRNQRMSKRWREGIPIVGMVPTGVGQEKPQNLPGLLLQLNVFREAQEEQEDGSQVVRCHLHRHQRMWCQDHGSTRLVARHLNHKRPVGAALSVRMVADTTWEGRNKAPWEIGWW